MGLTGQAVGGRPISLVRDRNIYAWWAGHTMHKYLTEFACSLPVEVIGLSQVQMSITLHTCYTFIPIDPTFIIVYPI